MLLGSGHSVRQQILLFVNDDHHDQFLRAVRLLDYQVAPEADLGDAVVSSLTLFLVQKFPKGVGEQQRFLGHQRGAIRGLHVHEPLAVVPEVEPDHDVLGALVGVADCELALIAIVKSALLLGLNELRERTGLLGLLILKPLRDGELVLLPAQQGERGALDAAEDFDELSPLDSDLLLVRQGEEAVHSVAEGDGELCLDILGVDLLVRILPLVSQSFQILRCHFMPFDHWLPIYDLPRSDLPVAEFHLLCRYPEVLGLLNSLELDVDAVALHVRGNGYRLNRLGEFRAQPCKDP